MLAPRHRVGPDEHELHHRHPRAAFPVAASSGNDRPDRQAVRGPRLGPAAGGKLRHRRPSSHLWEDDAAEKPPRRAPGRRRGEKSGDLTERSDLDGGEGRVGGGEGGKDRILELVVLGPEDDPAEAATDQRLGGGY